MNIGEIKESKILIVDDNPGNLGVLFDYLSKSEFTVLIAQSGEDAIELVNDNLPDIILLDILMPGIDGFETCLKLKEDDKTRDIPVLFVSSLSETVDKVRGFEVGGVDYISKPFQQEEVLARINTHLNIRNLKKRLEDKNKYLKQEIEERKKIEEELRKAKEESEAASLAKSTFLANMSHEIRTPMNAILGFTDILEKKIHDKDKRHYLELIRNGGKALLRLINDILDLSKIEAGKLEPEYTAADIRSVFTEIKQIFSQKIEEKNLKFILEIDSELPEALLFDSSRLRQVLLNLVGNAVKFTESGYIKILVNSYIHDDNIIDLIFSVEDTGVGIPEDEREFIFGAFDQRKGQSISKYGGTGLGLAITKRLVEMMGGSISVGGEEGKGSIFYVVIKDISIVKYYDTSKKEKMESENIRFKPALILIVDDMMDNRMLLMEYLIDFNFKIIEAENGRQAVDLAIHHCPELILMDIRMPVMDGLQATKIIKNSNETKHIPVIAVTASAMKHSEKEITSLCDGYLKKPVTKIDLISELTKFLEYSVEEPEALEAGQSSDECLEGSNKELCLETLEKIPELIQLLENKIEIWEDIVNTLTINDIEDFANQIIDMGKEYKYGILLKWGENLLERTMMFDMEALPEILNEFPEIIKNLQKLN